MSVNVMETAGIKVHRRNGSRHASSREMKTSPRVKQRDNGVRLRVLVSHIASLTQRSQDDVKSVLAEQVYWGDTGRGQPNRQEVVVYRTTNHPRSEYQIVASQAERDFRTKYLLPVSLPFQDHHLQDFYRQLMKSPKRM